MRGRAIYRAASNQGGVKSWISDRPTTRPGGNDKAGDVKTHTPGDPATADRTTSGPQWPPHGHVIWFTRSRGLALQGYLYAVHMFFRSTYIYHLGLWSQCKLYVWCRFEKDCLKQWFILKEIRPRMSFCSGQLTKNLDHKWKRLVIMSLWDLSKSI